jgi:L-cysteine/cystine lyase
VTPGTPLDDEHVRRIRTQLPAVNRIAYLNAGTLGPLPAATIEAMAVEREYDEQVRQDAGHWDRLTHLQGAARSAITALTGGTPDQVALMPSTHAGLNACLWGLDARPGDVIVTTDEEHPGLLVPLRHLGERAGVETRVAPWADGDEAFVASILEQVDEHVRAVALSHVSWSSGRVAPLRALRDALPAGVRIIVDGAQSAGAIVVDPSDGWDAYTVSGQKWPCGPNGSGAVTLVDPEAWAPTWGGFMQVVDHERPLDSAVVSDARRLETSQEALLPLAGIAASVAWLTGEVGLSRAHAHARHLNAIARSQLATAGVHDGAMHGTDHLLVIDVPDARANEIASKLFEAGVLVRPIGVDRIRASFGCWNLESEIRTFTDLLGSALDGS